MASGAHAFHRARARACSEECFGEAVSLAHFEACVVAQIDEDLNDEHGVAAAMGAGAGSSAVMRGTARRTTGPVLSGRHQIFVVDADKLARRGVLPQVTPPPPPRCAHRVTLHDGLGRTGQARDRA